MDSVFPNFSNLPILHLCEQQRDTPEMIKFDEIESSVKESRKGPDRSQPNVDGTAVGPESPQIVSRH